MTTFLGLPGVRDSVHSSPGVGHLQGSESFPTAGTPGAGRHPAARQHRPGDDDDPRQARGGRREVPDWEELREAGRTLKASTMARLPELLAQLEERVTAQGGTVHWARDAAEANAIVTRLVQATGRRRSSRSSRWRRRRSA
jgi:L-lactate dehydrogenase complex protein LldF